jgi:hypothetical protein
LRFAAQPAIGNNLLRVSAAVGQLSATGTTGTKQQYGGCNPQEVKVYGGYGPREVNVLRVPPAGCKSTAGVTCSKLRSVLVEPAGGTDFLRGALEPHTRWRTSGPAQLDFTAGGVKPISEGHFLISILILICPGAPRVRTNVCMAGPHTNRRKSRRLPAVAAESNCQKRRLGGPAERRISEVQLDLRGSLINSAPTVK